MNISSGPHFGVHKCGTVQRMAPSARWNLERLNQMRGAPWHWRAEEEAEVEAPVAKAVEKPEAEAEAESQAPTKKKPQRVWIMKHDVETRGATRGCGGCRAALDGRKGHKHT